VFFLFFGKMVNAFGSLQTDTDELVREVSKVRSGRRLAATQCTLLGSAELCFASFLLQKF
jgi:hypothetical protein